MVTKQHNLNDLREAINKCVRCGYCRQWDFKEVEKICPVLDFVPGWETNFARGHIWQARQILQSKTSKLSAKDSLNLEKLVTKSFLDDVYQCTLCGSCEAHCPAEVPLLEIYEAIRSELVNEDYMLSSHEALEFAIPALDPDAFSSDRPVAPSIIKAQQTRPKTAEILYYPGCTTATKTHFIPDAVISVLDKLKLDYTVLSPDEESCCGLPFYEVGQMDWFKEVAERTIEYIQRHKPKIIMTTCSGCYKFLSQIIPEELELKTKAKVIHFTEFILPKLKENQSLLLPQEKTVTFHDPCTLGRGSGIYEAPREIIKLLPGIQLLEMKNNRQHQICCGAGGGVGSAYPKLALQMSTKRLKQAEATGADILISSCAGCATNFSAAIDDTASSIEMRDIAEMINQALPP